MSYSLTELSHQTQLLGDDLAHLLPGLAGDSWQLGSDLPDTEDVFLLGSGDSLHAALAAREWFPGGRAATRPPHVLTATEYAQLPATPRRHLIVGISASGGNPALVAAVRTARAAGHVTVAITGAPASPLADQAEHVLVTSLDPAPLPCPGIRTYQASLAGLWAFGTVLGGQRPAGADDLADAVRRAADLARTGVLPLAEKLGSASAAWFTTTGASLAAARHAAAKVTETAALPALGVELEDWWHVHRFAHPPTTPLVVVLAPGASRATTREFVARARERRPVTLVGPAAELTGAGIAVPDVPDPFRPFVDHVFAGELARQIAEERGLQPFANA